MKRIHTKYTGEAAKLLGSLIKINRKEKKWSELELAKRAGMARATLQKIERGDLKCEIGLVFEAAVLVGIKLFDADIKTIEGELHRAREKLDLLPKHIFPTKKPINENF